jgi:alkylation response protein AidB-like acyl-CoA dehydrogenase
MIRNDAAATWTERARQLAESVLARHADDVDRTARWPAESVAALQAAGLFGLTVPVALGGAGAGPLDFAGVAGVLGEHCASSAMIYLMHICGLQIIAAAASFPEREAVLRAAAAGHHLSTLAFSERGSRSHFWAPVSQAERSGGTYRLSAEKSFVTSAGHADSYVVSTRSADAADPAKLTLFYVPGSMTGLTRNGAWNGLGLRGNESAPMRLEDVSLSASNFLSGDGEGFAMMMEAAVPWFQLGSAAIAVGIARAATAGIRGHLGAAKLEHLGQPLSSLLNLRARLAQMQIAVDTHQAYVDRVATLMQYGDPALLQALLEVKAAAGEAALHVTDLAMRTGGGASFGRRLTVERNFRDARACSVMAPTTDVLYDLIARLLLEMPLF